jgi:hypothetical protein
MSTFNIGDTVFDAGAAEYAHVTGYDGTRNRYAVQYDSGANAPQVHPDDLLPVRSQQVIAINVDNDQYTYVLGLIIELLDNGRITNINTHTTTKIG